MPLSDQIGKSRLGPRNVQPFENPETNLDPKRLIEQLRKQESDRTLNLGGRGYSISSVSMQTGEAPITSSEFNLNSYMDLINLQSDPTSFFTLTGSRIISWAEVGGTLWTQSVNAARPTLISNIPNFDGSDDTLLRESNIITNNISEYLVIKNTGPTSKIINCSLTSSDYLIYNTSYQLSLAAGGVSKITCEAGLGTQRFSVVSIRKNGNVVSMSINDRDLIQRTNTLAGENIIIGRLMSWTSAGFNPSGSIKAFCASSQFLSDEINDQIINNLYTRYNLSNDTASFNIAGFGDSNTIGQGTTSYLVNLATSMSLVPLNLGLSGTRLTNVGSTINNGYERYQTQLITKPYSDYIVIQYGTNDILGGVSASIFSQQYDEIVSSIISQGYSPSRICLCSVPYQASGTNSSSLDSYRTSISNIAISRSTKYFDLLQAMRDSGSEALLSDTVHLNATAMDIWGRGVFNAFNS